MADFNFSPSKEGPLSSELKKNFSFQKLKYLEIILATDSEKSWNYEYLM